MKYRSLVIRLKHWEFWPSYIANLPVVFFWIVQSIRAGHPMFFTAINPTIPTGGLFGESKRKIMQAVPAEYQPRTIFIDPQKSQGSHVVKTMHDTGIAFPVVVKPDIGERGFNVEKISTPDSLQRYIRHAKHEVILQEYIDYPLELCILCYKFPISGKRGISSVCRKEFLTVEGDGESTLRTLMTQEPRALLQVSRLEKRLDLGRIPASGEEVHLEPIGNHCRGTKFVNANAWIDEDLEKVILGILDRMPEIHYGRFDLRAKSMEDLRKGQNFRILEFNGTGSEPGHVYDPGYPFLRRYRDLWTHWKTMREIATEQMGRGVPPMPIQDAIRALRAYFGYKRQARMAFGRT